MLSMTIGYFLTIFCCVSAFEQREYFSVGGEWLILPIILVLIKCIEILVKGLKLKS